MEATCELFWFGKFLLSVSLVKAGQRRLRSSPETAADRLLRHYRVSVDWMRERLHATHILFPMGITNKKKHV